ncbi:ribosomal protein S18-alanine N-acetyltransferase [Pseudahrensia aquimaris]|uniref:Ribosomal protein S18-alanine N-acetyltransferase n=1 Tax=Pseudahrensia aquimaris TaxID=744461 RepID=A0ABW3FGT9_9HYPH
MFGRREVDVMILPGSVDNIAELAHLHQEGFRRGWTEDEMIALMEKPENIFLVAKVVGKPKLPIVGFNIMRETAEEAEILSIAVDPAWRGRDIGERLMREAINRLLADRVPALLLEVDENNLGAVRLYEKLGFKQVGSRPGYYRAVDPVAGSVQRSSALVMRLDLG